MAFSEISWKYIKRTFVFSTGPCPIIVFIPVVAPGRPSDVQVYAFAKYILVTWKAPLEPNGIITKYRVGSKEYPGSQPADDLAVNAQEVSAAVNRKLLGNHTPEKNYVVEIEARTRKGWGQKFKKTTATVKYAGKLHFGIRFGVNHATIALLFLRSCQPYCL